MLANIPTMNISSFIAPVNIPILDWIREYDKEKFVKDLVAGVTIFVFLIPQGMAYSILGGMPPVYGLYSSTVPLFVYAIFGTSRQLSLGPMAITSLLLGISCQSYGLSEGSPEYIQLALSVSLLVGYITVFLGIFRLGSLANLISPSMLTGFVTASSLVIFLNQLKYILGLHVPRFTYSHQTIIYLLLHLGECKPCEIIIGVAGFIALYVVREWKKRNKKPPKDPKQATIHRVLSIAANASNLVIIIVTAFIARALIQSGYEVAIIGDVPSGLLPPSFNIVPLSTLMNLLPSAFAIAIVAFAGNWAVGVKYAIENNYTIEATQELIATGLATVIGIIFNGFVVSGGLARTAVNAESGAVTQLSACITAILMLIAIICLTSYFYYIPMSTLGSIIEVSILSMIDFESMVKAYSIDKRDCLVMVITFLFTFFVGVSEGLFIGMFISMGVIMKTTAFPQIANLGKLPALQGGHFRNIHRFAAAAQLPGKAIIRMDASLYFANAAHFKAIILKAAQGEFHTANQAIDSVILDASAWIDIDLKGIETLFEIRNELQSQGIRLLIACAKGIIRDRLLQCKFMDDKLSFYMSLDDAVNDRKPIFMSQDDLHCLEGDEQEQRQGLMLSTIAEEDGEGREDDDTIGANLDDQVEQGELLQHIPLQSMVMRTTATSRLTTFSPNKRSIAASIGGGGAGEYVVLSRVISENSVHNPLTLSSSPAPSASSSPKTRSRATSHNSNAGNNSVEMLTIKQRNNSLIVYEDDSIYYI